jgi:N-acetylmuramoyl-L-alanine amidase
MPIIVLDAGHGGIDGGCTSADGVPEKGINLDILLKLRDMLEVSGYEVKVTRDSDRSIHDDGIEGIAAQKSSDMDNRLAIFNESDNAVCISIHQNQFTDPKYSGAQMFYSASNKRNEALAQSLQSSFAELLQPDNTREIKQCGKELFLCYYSENPTVMAECGFLSNPEEAALLVTEDYQQKVAFTLYAGIVQFCAG